MAARKKASAAATAAPTDDFEPDVVCIRTTDRDGRSHNGFQWPREIGAIVTCPDWNPKPVCGGGLHGNRDGVQDWSLLSDAYDALWWVVGARSEETVEIGTSKVKFPRAKVLYVGAMAGAMQIIAKQWRRIAQEAAEEAKTSGDYAHASTAGDGAHASTTGYMAHASTAGDRAHASTAGDWAHASTTGDEAHASTTGDWAHASATGHWATASTTGDIAHATTTGDGARASTTGKWAHASATGKWAHAITAGYGAHASATGGKNAVAVSLGANGSAQAAEGGWFVLAARDENGGIVLVKAFQAGQDGVLPNTAYRLLRSGLLEAAEG